MMDRYHFLVAMPHHNPFVIRHGAGDNSTYTGILAEMLDDIAMVLNFTYTIVAADHDNYGVEVPNGTWTGMIGQILRQEVDFAVGGFTITAARSEVVQFTEPFFEEYVTFTLQTESHELHSTYLKPFHSNVWGYLCLAVMIVSICSCFYQTASFKLVDNNKNDIYSMEHQSNTLCQITQEFINWFELVFTALIQKGSSWLPVHTSPRILLTFWWMFCTVIIAAYTGNLIAFLTVSMVELPVNHLEDLVADDKYHITTSEHSAFRQLLEESTAGVFASLWSRMQAQADRGFVDYTEFLQFISEDPHRVYIQEHLGILKYVHNKCKYRIAKDRFFHSNFAWPMRKDFPVMEQFNEKIRAMVQHGLVDRWTRRAFGEAQDRCTVSPSTPQSIVLYDVYGLYLLLIAGVVLAACVLAAEIVYKNKISKKL